MGKYSIPLKNIPGGHATFNGRPSKKEVEAVNALADAAQKMLDDANSLTDPQVKALEVLKDTTYENYMSASGFADRMWPGNTMHKKRSKGGHGVQPGKAAWLCAGSYLAKLVKKGWVTRHFTGYGFYISDKGKKLLDFYLKLYTHGKNKNASKR